MTDLDLRIDDVAIPPMAVGTMYFGTHVPTPAAHACLDTAFETGSRFLDTANNYAFWARGTGNESEATIGSWLARKGSSVRDQVTIATKIGARPRRTGGDLSDALGLSGPAIRDQVHASLSRLRTGHIDVLYAHVDDPDTPFTETLGALGELIDAGLVRTIAASNLTPERLHTSLTTPSTHHYEALQQRFTYLVPAPTTDLSPHVLLDEDTIAVCAEHGLTMLGYSPLLSGAYTRHDRPYPEGYRPTEAALRTLDEVAEAHDLDRAQAVLSWMVRRSQPVVPVVGVSRPDQVVDAWTGVTTDLTAHETAVLDHARTGSSGTKGQGDDDG